MTRETMLLVMSMATGVNTLLLVIVGALIKISHDDIKARIVRLENIFLREN
jgi:hypothetical protein